MTRRGGALRRQGCRVPQLSARPRRSRRRSRGVRGSRGRSPSPAPLSLICMTMGRLPSCLSVSTAFSLSVSTAFSLRQLRIHSRSVSTAFSFMLRPAPPYITMSNRGHEFRPAARLTSPGVWLADDAFGGRRQAMGWGLKISRGTPNPRRGHGGRLQDAGGHSSPRSPVDPPRNRHECPWSRLGMPERRWRVTRRSPGLFVIEVDDGRGFRPAATSEVEAHSPLPREDSD